MSENLKPCPFCGGEAELVIENHREYPSTYYVACKSRCLRQYSYNVKGMAIKAWNRRENNGKID